MRKALLGVALALWLAPAADAAPHILFVSNVAGPTQIYAADPAGKAPVGQITSAAPITCTAPSGCGVSAPLPSPDGRQLLFRGAYSVYRNGLALDSQALWVARWNGTGIRRVWPHGDEEVGKIAAAAWDSVVGY